MGGLPTVDYTYLLLLIAFLLSACLIYAGLQQLRFRHRRGKVQMSKTTRRVGQAGELVDVLTSHIEEAAFKGKWPSQDVAWWYKTLSAVPVWRNDLTPRFRPKFPHPDDVKAGIRKRVSLDGLAKVEAKHHPTKKPLNRLDAIALRHPKIVT